MKKIAIFPIIFLLSIAPIQRASAQLAIAEIIKAAIKKVIKAVDLKIQRLQNNTIWLQNAQKTLENQLSKLKLDEIGNWAEKQRKLYADYFDELWKIKNAISTYQKVRDIIGNQVKLVQEYQRAFSLSRQDRNFTLKELDHMQDVYTGILDESMKSVDELQIVINSFRTQMSDAKRLELIENASASIEQNLADLRQFNQENIRTSLQRVKETADIEVIKKLYGLR